MRVTFALAVAVLALAAPVQADTIPVTADNFAQAETAWNFANWARRGADSEILHLREVSPVGPGAPTVRMNWDTLYSVRIVDVSDDRAFTVTLPATDLYLSVQILDENGFSPHFVVEPGDHDLTVTTDFAFALFRTELKDRRDPDALARAHAVQDRIAVSGVIEAGRYEAPAFDQAALEQLRATYKKAFLESGTDYTFARGPGQVDQNVLDLSHAAGWGGYPPELGVSNAYSSSAALSGDACLAVTFEDPENRFFTSFTLYDVDGYLIEGDSHINSNMWTANTDGTITIHFNCGADAVNALSSKGAPFNYSVRNYGVSQPVLDGEFRPVVPVPAGG